MKQVAVVFTRNNARIFKGPDVLSVKHLQNCIVNPDLSRVAGVPPHYWKCRGKMVVEMNPFEKRVINRDIRIHGVDNDVETKFVLRTHTKFNLFASVIILLMIAGLYA